MTCPLVRERADDSIPVIVTRRVLGFPPCMVVPVSELWESADRLALFDRSALSYDKYRPRYPEEAFRIIADVGGLGPGSTVLEIGAGTGIATQGLIGLGLSVTALEPSSAMAAIAGDRFGDRITLHEIRFEDWDTDTSFDLVAAFNSWHWVEPAGGIEGVAKALVMGSWISIVWTGVIQWGEEPFASRLAEITGAAWPLNIPEVVGTARNVEDDPRFGPMTVRSVPFARSLSAEEFVSVTRTYGGSTSAEQFRQIADCINTEFGGSVTKIEEAQIFMAQREAS
jgi:SAM-dependent methyltransferase